MPHKSCIDFYAACSYAFSGLRDIDINVPTSLFNAVSMLTVSGVASPVSVLEVPDTKITAEHHIHFTVAETFAATDLSANVIAYCAVAKASRMVGAHTAFLTGLALWATSVADPIAIAYLCSSIFDAASINEWAGLTKIFTVRLKPLQTYMPFDLHHLFEVEVLANRGVGAVNWDQERRNRVEPNLAAVDPYTIYTYVHDLFLDAHGGGKRLQPVPYADYWDTRWQWSTLGSVHSQYQQDRMYVSQEHKLKNKFHTLCSMPDLPLDYWASRQPSIHAWASVKWEWGKQRAIYGTDLTSYIMFDYVMKGCEEFFPCYIPVGVNATTDAVARSVAKLKSQGIPMCLDFEDFNSQHSAPAMRAVLQAFYDVFGPSMCADQRAAFAWCMQSLDTQVVHNNLTCDAPYQSKGTLFSGWRLTTFMNTALNYAYTSILAERAGVVIVDRLHNGDDALLSLNTPADAFKLLESAAVYNIRVKSEKSNICSVVEFLRVDASTSAGRQYLARAIATLVHSRTESGPPNDLHAAVQASATRLEEATLRGLPLHIVARLVLVSDAVLAKSFSTVPQIVHTARNVHRIFGGVSDSTCLLPTVCLRRLPLHTIVDVDARRLPGVISYARRVHGQLGSLVPFSEVLDGVSSATLVALSTTKTTLGMETVPHAHVMRMRYALYRSHRIVKNDYTFGLGRLIGSLEKVSGMSANLRSLVLAIAPGDSLREWLPVLC